MPAYMIEYGVVYYVEKGPSRDRIFDSARLGLDCGIGIDITLRGNPDDWIGPAAAKVQGVHQYGSDDTKLFVYGRLHTLTDLENKPLPEIWYKAFFFAELELTCWSCGPILFGERSFMESPLKPFKPFAAHLTDKL